MPANVHVSDVQQFAEKLGSILSRIAALERMSGRGGGGAIDWSQGYPTYDPRYVNVPGDRMTGKLEVLAPIEELALARSDGANSPHLGFYDSTFTTRYAYVMGRASGLLLAAQVGDVRLNAGGVDQLIVDGQFVTTPGMFRAGMPADFWSLAQTGIFFPSGSSGLGGITSNGSYRIGFYSNGYRGGPGGSTGWYNFNVNGIVGSAALEVDPSGLILLKAQATAPASSVGPAEVARVNPNAFLVGKTAYNTWQTAAGFETWAATGATFITTDTNTFSAITHLGASDANGISFLRFYRAGTTLLSAINQTTSPAGIVITGAVVTAPSHGPFKGNIETLADDAFERVERWRPVAFQWRLDEHGDYDERAEPSGPVYRGFIAQELYEVQPDAVAVGTGTEEEHRAWREATGRYIASVEAATAWDEARELDLDADIGQRPEVVDDPGDDPFSAWQVDKTALIPDLVAAVQALIRTVRAQAERIADLEARC